MRNLLPALLLASAIHAADPEVRMEVPKEEVWTGQNIPLTIELRAPGTFSGSPVFDLPDIPRSLIIKKGTPVLSNETVGDTEFFIQSHDFMLVSQSDGVLEIPPIPVRFSHKKGYTGEDFDVELQTDAATVTLKRPPGTSEAEFIITCEAIEVSESWDPQPGDSKVGDALKRTVTQTVVNMSGIALRPFPENAPEGIRIYVDEPAVSDKVERGKFDGKRTDSVTYLVQQPGDHTIPEITYQWWNPTSEKIESQVLPAVSFTATVPPPPPEPPSPWRYLSIALAVALAVTGFLLRHQIATLCAHLRNTIDPPPRRAGRAFLKACRQNDAPKAMNAWSTWIRMHPTFDLPVELKEQIRILERHLFGPSPEPGSWNGRLLAKAFRRRSDDQTVHSKPTALPPLNA